MSETKYNFTEIEKIIKDGIRLRIISLCEAMMNEYIIECEKNMKKIAERAANEVGVAVIEQINIANPDTKLKILLEIASTEKENK